MISRRGYGAEVPGHSRLAGRFASVNFWCFLWFVFLPLAWSNGETTGANDHRPGKQAIHPESYAAFVGTYGRGETDIMYFAVRDGKLTARPAFWHSIQTVELKNDSFVVADRKDRGGMFIRNAGGGVVSVRITGLAPSPLQYEKLHPRGRLPLELLFDGKGAEAYDRLSGTCGYRELLQVGTMFFEHFPTRSRTAVDYMNGMAKQYADSSDVLVLLGRAFVSANQRARAIETFRKALALNAANQAAMEFLVRLRKLSVPAEIAAAQWKLPYALSALFEPPTPAEIETVRRTWAGRDLSVDDFQEVEKGIAAFGGIEVRVRIVSHRVHGFRHYGAVIVPARKVKPGTCPVILEARGVAWNYPPLDISSGLTSPSILGRMISQSVILVPSFRGEKLVFNGREFLSEGDRTDGWDGATDDALALLNAALQSTPEADPRRIVTFGRSRGGSVAMLAATRDRRIGGVIEWAAPVDWFALMATEGWTQQELVEEGLRIHAKPYETAGQFIERFLTGARAGSSGLSECRLKMLASSPLYFAGSLPNLQIHHGVEDYSVPVANARALSDVLKKRSRSGDHVEVFLYEGFGHDTDITVATKRSAVFVLKRVKSGM